MSQAPKKPDPFRKPAPRAAGDDDSDDRDERDWGLPREKKSGGGAMKIGLLVVLVAAGGAGYVAWDKYYKKPKADTTNGETADKKESDSPDENSGVTKLASLDEEGDSGDPFGESSAAKPKKLTLDEPGHMGDMEDAQPLDDLGGPTIKKASKKPLAARDEFSLDDEVKVGEQSEPSDLAESESDPLGTGAAPRLKAPSQPPRRLAIPVAEDDSALDSEADSTGPSIKSAGPALKSAAAAKSIEPDSLDDKLGGFDVAEERTSTSSLKSAASSTKSSPSKGPAISMIEVDDDEPAATPTDDRLDGYIAEEITSRRATSKTVVTRGNVSPPANLLADATANPTYGNRSGQATPIMPKGTAPPVPVGESGGIPRRSSPPVPAAIDRFGTSSKPLPTTGRPAHGETYTVTANDSFWDISRKVYGSARYFNALTRHNQHVVPDPQRLKPGMMISTPPASVLEQKYPDLIEKAPAAAKPVNGGSAAIPRSTERPVGLSPLSAGGVETATESTGAGLFHDRSGRVLYRVGPDDTLTGIAQRHLGRASRWSEIYENNQDILKSPDNLTLGTVIRLPADASLLSRIPDGPARR